MVGSTAPKGSASKAPRSLAPRQTSLQPLIGSLRPSRIRSLLAAASPPKPASPSPAPIPPRRTGLKLFASAAALIVSMGVGLAAKGLLSPAPESTVHHRTALAGPGFKSTGSGAHVRWHDDAVTVVLDDSLNAIDPSAPDVFSAALKAWRKSGASLPSVSTVPGRHRQPGYQAGGDNENVIVFAKYGWPRAGNALAVTILTFEDSGKLLDADMVFNGGGRFFGVLDGDEASGDASDAVSIDGAPSTGASGDSQGASSGSHRSQGDSDGEQRYATTRFDLQSVATHELGHFFGLDEDYDDATATMYIKTSPGETHTRVLTTPDTNAIVSLYAEPVADDGQKGCGGAAIAPGARAAAGYGSFGLVALGVAAMGIVLATRARKSRWISHAGAYAAAAGLTGALVPPLSGADAIAPRQRGDATARVIAAEPSRDGGLVETRLRLQVTTCRTGQCPTGEQTAVVMGGSIGQVTQVVGGAKVPRPGDEVELIFDGARRLVPMLTPRMVAANRANRGHR